jgi:beta-mannosidase
VHTDLMAAGLVPDPYLDENETALSWIGRTDWRYATSFDAAAPSAGERVDLVFEGLDTVATVTLNDEEVLHSENMHRTYRVDVGAHLRDGGNDLQVDFDAALPWAEQASDRIGPRPHANAHPFNAIRKMACSFGWDWGPDTVTAGLWRPVRLHRWRTARLGDVRVLATLSDARVRAHVEVVRDSDSAELSVTVSVGDQVGSAPVATGETGAVVDVAVRGAEAWWPHTRGAQPLYDVEVVLHDGHDELDRWSGRTGFRDVTLDTDPDEHGTPFTFVVNGERLFIRGANWIPDDAFPSRVDRARYERRLRQAKDADIDLLRVWGGGIFESDDFYDLCDELGILVWQDFLFACAAYAEEEPLRSEVEAEAREAVTRLARHPSLVLWNGCNENIWGHQDWGWIDQLGDRTWGLGYYTGLLPAIVAELDGTRPYSAGSPWSLDPARHPNDPDHGTMHIWDVWNERDYLHYRDHVPRFAAEFGYQGPPTWATLTRAVHDAPLRPDGPAMLLHQKAEHGNEKLHRGLGAHFPPVTDMTDWHWATSLNQARAVTVGVEHLRSWSPRCAGSIVWQLNDCWPVTSWAAVDGYGRRKPMWYALRRSYRDRLLTVQPREHGLALVAVNDTATDWRADLDVRRLDHRGEVLANAALLLAVPRHGTVTLVLPRDLARAGDPSTEVLIASTADDRALWFYAEDRDSDLHKASLTARVVPVAGGARVEVTAHTLVRDLALLADKVSPDAEVDEMLVTLLPGESTTFTVRSTGPLDADALCRPDVLRCANQLVTD